MYLKKKLLYLALLFSFAFIPLVTAETATTIPANKASISDEQQIADRDRGRRWRGDGGWRWRGDWGGYRGYRGYNYYPYYYNYGYNYYYPYSYYYNYPYYYNYGYGYPSVGFSWRW